jgi:DNA processing protein
MPRHFVQRNALLAAMTLATVVVEAGVESGARSTAAIARRLGRPVLAVPNAPWDPRGAGCLQEIALGALPLTRAADVFTAIGAAHRLGGAEVGAGPPVPPVRPQALGVRRRASRAPELQPPAEAPASTEPRGSTPTDAPFGPDERAVLDALAAARAADHPASAPSRPAPMHLDEVCERTGLSPPRAAGALLTLTLHAVVVEGPAGSYRRARR